MCNFFLFCNEVFSKWFFFIYSVKENEVLLENNVKYIVFDDYFWRNWYLNYQIVFFIELYVKFLNKLMRMYIYGIFDQKRIVINL